MLKKVFIFNIFFSLLVIPVQAAEPAPYPGETVSNPQCVSMTKPIFRTNTPDSQTGLLLQENFEDFIFKGYGGAAGYWYFYGPSGTDQQWLNTGNNNLRLVSSFNDSGKTVYPREGKRAVLWKLNADDIGSSSFPAAKQTEWHKRSEIRKTNDFYDYGTEYWYGFSLYIPSDHKPDPVGEIFIQFHNESDGTDRNPNGPNEGALNPPVGLHIVDNRYQLAIKGDDRELLVKEHGVAFSYKRNNSYDLGPIDKGTWTDWVINIKWSWHLTTNLNDPNAGFVRVWKNGEPVKVWKNGEATTTSVFKGANCYNDLVGPYLKFGIYKPGWSNGSKNDVKNRTLMHDAVRVSKRLPGEPEMSMNGYNRVAPKNSSSCTNDPTGSEPTPTVNVPTPTTTVPANKYDVTGEGNVDILDIIEVIKYLFGS